MIWHHIGNWLYSFTGTGGTGPRYGFWSGFGSDIGEVAILGGLVGIYRKHTCHIDHCWRISRHQVDGTPYIVCRKHHPTVPPKVTADHVARAHRFQSVKGTK